RKETAKKLLEELVDYAERFKTRLSQRMSSLQDSLASSKRSLEDSKRSHALLDREIEGLRSGLDRITDERSAILERAARSVDSIASAVERALKASVASVPSLKGEAGSAVRFLSNEHRRTISESLRLIRGMARELIDLGNGVKDE